MNASSAANPRRPVSARLAPLAIITVAAIIAAPILFIMLRASADTSLIASQLGATYVSTTLALCVLVGIFASAIGIVTAFAVSVADFPGRRFFDVALVLPFATPAYISAFAWADVFSPFGLWASIFGVSELPTMRSFGGAVFILTLATYPYVFVAMRAALSARSAAFLEAARMLGAGPLAACRRILLGASQPALFGGLALVLMETAAEFGVADYFGVQTLSVGIFRTWYGRGDLAVASQLALMLFAIAALLVLLEEIARRGMSAENVRATRAPVRIRTSAVAGAGLFILCLTPVLLGFIAPAVILIAKAYHAFGAAAFRGLADAAFNTAVVAGLGAAIASFVAIILAYAARKARSPAVRATLRAATLGYAIPGAVIAIGLLSVGNVLSAQGAAISGVFLLIYAYVARFLSASYNASLGGLAQIHPLIDDAARTLGANGARILRRIHLPLTRGSVLAGAAIVAIDIAKELPATLILRPFNFETLSSRVYRLAADERLAEAAPAALALIGLSILPVVLLIAASRTPKNNWRTDDFSPVRQ